MEAAVPSADGHPRGKYYIDKVTHSIGNGYTMTLDLSLVG